MIEWLYLLSAFISLFISNKLVAFVASFFSSSTYENVLDAEGFPQTLEPIWILGTKYSLLHGTLATACEFVIF